MEFIFKELQYQLDAVKAVTDVFKGQPNTKLSQYTRDIGKLSNPQGQQMRLFGEGSDLTLATDDEDYAIGYANNPIQIDDNEALHNIQDVQERENIKRDTNLIKKISPLDLDVEMETGTGKTYVYIRTIFELNKLYGFSKFIIMVPSIAIREGVKKSFKMTENHFYQIYQKKATYFIYNSSNLSLIDSFAKSNSIQVMIINSQAFNSSTKENRNIYKELETFQSRRPIDVIKKTNPILILDEPQKLSGKKTTESIKNFNPLFTINYSATHKEHHNLVYVLDALDAYNQKLVKKIQVKAITVSNIKGTNDYLYLEDIILQNAGNPKIRLSFYKNTKNGIKEVTETLGKGDNIYNASGELTIYKNRYIIDEIDYISGTVKLLNGKYLKKGEVYRDDSQEAIRKAQIRETIKSHFDKEAENFKKGIKTLSLFFIDEVVKYRDYDRPDEKGEYARYFEEEYQAQLNSRLISESNPAYVDYLKKYSPDQVHKGYFSIDKKTGHSIDTTKEDDENNTSAYDLILKNKERLLSFDEPTRFIFSHSALREGWDNPNIFQICTLRNTNSEIQKRQEIGRGLRIALNQNGTRQDLSVLGKEFFEVNKLTVIANDSYDNFVRGLQEEYKQNIYERPSKADEQYFISKFIINCETGEKKQISKEQSHSIYRWLLKNDYIDDNDNITDKFKEDLSKDSVESLPIELIPYKESIINLVSKVGTKGEIEIENGNKPVINNSLNSNFRTKEFQELWNNINHKYSYRVSFNSNELIENCINSIKANLTSVTRLKYNVVTGQQNNQITKMDLDNKNSFSQERSGSYSENIDASHSTSAKYDLIYNIAKKTNLIRKTVSKILIGTKETLRFFRENPEEYINKVSELINQQKASVIVNHISYYPMEDRFESDIFNESHKDFDSNKVFESKKAIQDYVFVDGNAKNGNSIEMNFAKQLEAQKDVKVYAKLPSKFYIPTPMGKYTPDWAIVFENDKSREIYFIAETKGSLDSLELRAVEQGKINCAKSLYNKEGSKLHYEQVTKFDDLYNSIAIIDKNK